MCNPNMTVPELNAATAAPTSNERPFQLRVVDWMMETFSNEVCRDTTERNHRYLEESLELVQAMGCTRAEAHMLVDYVFGRPAGEPEQEVGGAMVTLAALCAAADFSMRECGERELARCWQNIERIRAKQAGKPRHSPLPRRAPDETSDALDAARYRFLRQPGNAIVYAKDRNAWGAGASGHVRYDKSEQLDAAVDAARGSPLKASEDRRSR